MRKRTFMAVLVFFEVIIFMEGFAAVPEKFRCRLWEDAQGITHVKSDTETELFGCMGFVHGRDRAFQMDFLRRTAQGRVAEILGAGEIKSDFRMRLLGLYPRAREVGLSLPESLRAKLEAYSSGVNEGVRQATGSGVDEFRRWNYRPEAWTPADTIALVLLQSFDQTRKTFGVELQEEEWKKEFPGMGAGSVSSDGLPWDTAVLKAGEFEPRSPSVSWNADWKKDEGFGSNNWVIDPSRSKTNHAWLANDPHLRLQSPPMWHWIHVEGGGWNVIGAAVPGIPAVMSGSNLRLSWGLTNAYLDVGRLAYVPLSDLSTAVSERPTIWFRFLGMKLPFFFKTFQRTTAGNPVVPMEGPRGKAIVLHWMGLHLSATDIHQTLSALFQLMAARDSREADQIFSAIKVPSWNFVFSDGNGTIGYRAVGRVPKQTKAPPFGIEERSLAAWEKQMDEIPDLHPDEMPHVFRPKRGFVATANNRQWPAQAAFHGGAAYVSGFRAFRIEELIQAEQKHDLESLRKMQCDVQAVDARFLVPLMLKALPESVRLKNPDVLLMLREWESADYFADAECRACPIFRRWMDHLLDDEKIGANMLYRRISGGESPDPGFSGKIIRAFENALEDVRRQETGSSPWPFWKEIHFIRFPHLAGEFIFGKEGLASEGDDNTVNPGTADWNEDERLFEHFSGASQRLVVEMSDPPKVYSVLPGLNHMGLARDLKNSQGPWMQWNRCELIRRKFPVEWSEVPAKEVSWEGRGD